MAAEAAAGKVLPLGSVVPQDVLTLPPVKGVWRSLLCPAGLPVTLMMTMMVDAFEGRDVATADVAGAYLNVDMPDYVLLRFTGDMIDIMCEANPELAPGIIIDGNGQRVLIVILAKALYGCVKSGLL